MESLPRQLYLGMLFGPSSCLDTLVAYPLCPPLFFFKTHPTEGLPARVNQPFLKRNMQSLPSAPSPSAYIAESGLEIKVCIGSYKLFFVPDTEDFFSRRLSTAEEHVRKEAAEQRRKAAKAKLDRFVEGKMGGGETGGEDLAGAAPSPTLPADESEENVAMV